MAAQLNPAQHDAVHTLQGPLLVLAGAGTGKTRVVTYRIAELIRSGIKPERILAVTFTNKAAGEMQQRATELLKSKRKNKPEISTFHSLCVRVLRRHITQLGYPAKFAIYDRGDQEGAARDALRQIKIPGETLRPGDLLNFISRWKSAAIRPQQAIGVAETDKEHLAAVAYRRYQNNLKGAGAVDFDDLLLLVEELFRTKADVRRSEAGRFDHLLVDEYQDTNGSQYRIVKALAAGHRNLCVVGDDDQSIYGWRGAEVAHILSFRRDWPEAKVVRLEDNYRSKESILTIANRLIRFNQQRHDKVLRAARRGGDQPRVLQFRDEEEEARETIVDIKKILSVGKTQPRDIAILFRTNEQPRPFEMELRKADLPYVLIGGMSFYDRREVRDILAYLKLLAHPTDEVALLRVLNRPPRGIGQSSVALLSAKALENAEPLWNVLDDAPQISGIQKSVADAILRFQDLINRFRKRAEKGSLTQLVRDLIEQIDYRRDINRRFPSEQDQLSRWATIEEIVNALARYEKRNKKPTLAGFLDEVALAEQDENDDKESQLARNAIALMTLHSAKGLEFPQVYMVGMEEQILPHKMSIQSGTGIDEERRLCYVGVTRAQDKLTMSLALQRTRWGRAVETLPSRFLYELAGNENKAREVAAASMAKKQKQPFPSRKANRSSRKSSSR